MKRYRARRIDGQCQVGVETTSTDGNFQFRPLDPRNDLFNHSPDGFEWGYGGSGPAQLALALLADATGDDALAVRLHQEFKEVFIAPANQDGFHISQKLILDWVRLRKERT